MTIPLSTPLPPVSMNGNLLIFGCLAAQIVILKVCVPYLRNCSVRAQVCNIPVLSHAQEYSVSFDTSVAENLFIALLLEMFAQLFLEH